MADVKTGRGETKIKRFFVGADGQVLPRPQLDTSQVVWHFLGNDHRIQLEMGSLSEGVLRAAAAFGLSTAAGNAAGGEEDLNEAIDAVEKRVKSFLAGVWSEGRSAGPDLDDLVAAWAADRKRNKGANITPENEAVVLEALKSGKLDPVATSKEPGIKAELAAIKAQRAQERAEEVRAKAVGKPAVQSAVDALVGI